MRRRRLKIRDAPSRALLNSKGWRTTVVVILVVLCAALIFTLAVRYRNLSSGPRRDVYEGRIVDKSITITESQTGSGAVHRLHARGRNGVVFNVPVTDGLYERAQVGMWIRGGPDGPELFATEPPPADAATKTEGAETPSVSAPR